MKKRKNHFLSFLVLAYNSDDNDDLFVHLLTTSLFCSLFCLYSCHFAIMPFCHSLNLWYSSSFVYIFCVFFVYFLCIFLCIFVCIFCVFFCVFFLCVFFVCFYVCVQWMCGYQENGRVVSIQTTPCLCSQGRSFNLESIGKISVT